MMRMAVILLCGAALVSSACRNKNGASEARMDESYTSFDQMDAAPAQTSDYYATDTMQREPAPVMATAAVPTDEELSPAGGNTHVVRKGETLYSLARRFYSDQAKWKDIWDANRAQLSDPEARGTH